MQKRLTTKKVISLYLLLCGLFIHSFAVAQDTQSDPDNHERWYQVEMIIFSRNENNASQQETWPKNIKLNYPANFVTLKASDAIDPNGFTMLKPNDRQLNAQAVTLAKSGSYSVLFHQAWRQMIYAKRTAILINGGKTFNGHQELEGSIDLSVAQYLKLQTNLWLTQFVQSHPAISNAAASGITAEPSIHAEMNEGWPELPTITNSEIIANDHAADYVTNRIVKINQQRSMRSAEVHYIDHPLLGIIIKILPYDAPIQ